MLHKKHFVAWQKKFVFWCWRTWIKKPTSMSLQKCFKMRMVQVADQMQISSNIQKFWKLVFHSAHLPHTEKYWNASIGQCVLYHIFLHQKKIFMYGITYIFYSKYQRQCSHVSSMWTSDCKQIFCWKLAPVYMEKFKKSLHVPQVIPQKN